MHIDTGIFGFGAMLRSAIQDVIVGLIWMGLVWAVHALVVMLEWCFTIDLLPSAAAGALGRGLRQMEATFTQPWLVLSLSLASIFALYHGLIRRRVAETVGEALMMAAMMIGGLWVISDPTGTVGALGAWANQAALGTLAVVAQGAPGQPERTFAGGLDTVFATAIEGPWCYLEFGDVGWCREPSRLDPKLRAAGLAIAAAELAQAGCGAGAVSSSRCVSGGSEQPNMLTRSAEMLRAAQSNGAIFLALPANGPARNSINEQGSLLRTLCQSSEATRCRGPAAAQAQFRTGGETLARVVGLMLIAAGLLGLLLLLGFVASRLLAAALFSLFYLLLAPAMVLAPAFGEGGRALFRRWGMQLLGTVVAKLLFSFLLGIVLALIGVISSLTALGWWTQWLLMSALWWGAYTRRHQALGVAAGAIGRRYVERPSIGRRVGAALGARGREKVERWNERRRSKKRAPEVEPRPTPTPTPKSPPRKDAGKPGGRTPARTEQGRQRSARDAQLGRIRQERTRAEAAGDRRRVIELRARERRVEGEIEDERASPARARERASGGGSSSGAGSSGAGRPRPGVSGSTGGRASSAGGEGAREHAREYAPPVAPAGSGPGRQEQPDFREGREMRLSIEPELARRRELNSASGSAHRPVGRGGGRAGTDGAEGAEGAAAPKLGEPGELPRRGRGQESSVMRDAREVEAGRKRQLGLGRS